MKSEQLFRMLGDIDDAFILEAEEEESHLVLWKTVAAAAVVAVAIGTVWFTARMLNRPAPDPGPPELAAPVVSAEPGAPDETAAPDVSAAPSTPDETAVPDVGVEPGASGAATAPDVETTAPAPITTDVPEQSPPPASPMPSQPGIPGGSGSTWPGVSGFGGSTAPGFGGATVPYRGAYYHSAAGDYLVFRSPVLGVPVVTVNITGQITDGHYAGTVSGFPFGESYYVELQVHDDGSYDLFY